MRRKLGLVLATGLLLAAVMVTGSVLVLRLFYAWSLVLAFGYVWTALSPRGLSIVTSPLPDRAQAGATLTQDVSVSAAGRLPRFGLQLQAISDLRERDAPATIDIPAGGVAEWQSEYRLKRRGRYGLGQFRLASADPFGLFHRETILGKAQDVIVHPQTVALPSFNLSGLGGLGLNKRMPEGLSSTASTIREYTSGDSLRHIHWKSTAHTGRYMVKTFDAERSRHRAENYWVILDMAAAAHSGRGDDATAEYAVTLAASLGREYLANGFRFGLLTSLREPAVVPAAGGQKQLTEILDLLAGISDDSPVPVTELVARHQNLFGSDSTVVVITPSNSSALTETYHQLTAKGCAAAYFLIDGVDFGGASPAAAGRALTQLGAPVYLLRRAETFRQSLEQAVGGNSWISGLSRL